MRIKDTLDTVLEHGSHAWRALEVAGMVAEEDVFWPPKATGAAVGSAPYHLAAMLQYIKQLHDQLGALEDSRFE